MNDAAAMGVVQSLGAIEYNLGGSRQRQQPLRFAVRFHGRRAVHIFHHQVWLIVLFACVQDADDVGMIEHLRGMGFVEKHLARHSRGLVLHPRAQLAHFDGHVPFVERVISDIHDSHVSAPGGADHGILADFLG